MKYILVCIALLCVVGVAVPLPALAQSSSGATVADTGLVKCGTQTANGRVSNPCGFTDFIRLIKGIADFLIVLGVAVAALVFAWAGFLYLTAAGNMHKIEEAHGLFGKVLIGFLLMLSAWLIVNTIEKTLLKKDNQDASYLKN